MLNLQRPVTLKVKILMAQTETILCVDHVRQANPRNTGNTPENRVSADILGVLPGFLGVRAAGRINLLYHLAITIMTMVAGGVTGLRDSLVRDEVSILATRL